jgi:hypothetical protein
MCVPRLVLDHAGKASWTHGHDHWDYLTINTSSLWYFHSCGSFSETNDISTHATEAVVWGTRPMLSVPSLTCQPLPTPKGRKDLVLVTNVPSACPRGMHMTSSKCEVIDRKHRVRVYNKWWIASFPIWTSRYDKKSTNYPQWSFQTVFTESASCWSSFAHTNKAAAFHLCMSQMVMWLDTAISLVVHIAYTGTSGCSFVTRPFLPYCVGGAGRWE